MHNRPPVQPTNASPKEIIGQTNYELWTEIAQWIVFNRGGDVEKFNDKLKKRFNDMDMDFYRRKLDELIAHGFVYVHVREESRFRWMTRLKNDTDIIFEAHRN